ncbi:hypothetical protein EDB86DRAFT_2915751, partial [Lactarius hatsudake]
LTKGRFHRYCIFGMLCFHLASPLLHSQGLFLTCVPPETIIVVTQTDDSKIPELEEASTVQSFTTVNPRLYSMALEIYFPDWRKHLLSTRTPTSEVAHRLMPMLGAFCYRHMTSPSVIFLKFSYLSKNGSGNCTLFASDSGQRRCMSEDCK